MLVSVTCVYCTREKFHQGISNDVNEPLLQEKNHVLFAPSEVRIYEFMKQFADALKTDGDCIHRHKLSCNACLLCNNNFS